MNGPSDQLIAIADDASEAKIVILCENNKNNEASLLKNVTGVTIFYRFVAHLSHVKMQQISFL